MRVIVYHSFYGCDSGCCGHTVEILEEGQEQYEGKQKFNFDHPWNKEPIDFARELIEYELGKDHVSDLDWENCRIIND